MSESKSYDTLMRQWHMLRAIPRHPSKITAQELVSKLESEGFEINSVRTIQRDLQLLSSAFQILCNKRGKPYGWSWSGDATALDIPGMDSHTALAFWLANQHLRTLLPMATLDHLQASFDHATRCLNRLSEKKGVLAWRDKVRVLHRAPQLQCPVVDQDVQRQVYEALLLNRKLSVIYHSRKNDDKSYEINPLAMIVKDGISYLVVTIRNYKNIRLLALHRILQAKKTDMVADLPMDFNLDVYIESGDFNLKLQGKVYFKALFSAPAAKGLKERPLSDDQNMIPQEDGRVLLSGTTQDCKEFRWWLLGFGSNVEVLQPQNIRNDIQKELEKSLQQYV